jgi:transcriptional regulator with XRE-family HTH domain
MLTERIQEAIRAAGMSRYAISKATGVDQGLLCRFLKGQSRMSLDTVDKVLGVLGLEIELRPSRMRKDG